MNQFIELRKKLCKYNNPYIFSFEYLNQYLNINETISMEKNNTIDKIKKFKAIEAKNLLKERDFYEVLSFLGQEEHLDRYIVDLILRKNKNIGKDELRNIISTIIMEDKYNQTKLYHLIDISIECNIETLGEKNIYTLLENYKKDFDIISILIEYIGKFRIGKTKVRLYQLLEDGYPKSLILQILDLIIELYGLENLDEDFIGKIFSTSKERNIFNNYMKFIQEKVELEKEKIVILQSMFYGDFEGSGRGNNGGLAIFLKSLGKEISRDEKVAMIITITISDYIDQAFINYYGDKHLFVRLPIYIDRKNEDPFVKRELYIKRYIYKFLKRANINPDVFHIRYLDNASRAVALLSKELNKKLVFTLTPDPHRSMFEEDGTLRKFSFDEFIKKLNKIKIGDELIYESDGILGIGNKSVKDELKIYFPQINERVISNKLKTISEGIDNNSPEESEDMERKLDARFLSEGIDKNFFDKPTILNVGRLDNLKGQTELLKAWGCCKLSKTHNLLIVGGDLDNPNSEERIIIGFFQEYLKANSHLKGNFCHMQAMPNEKIKLLENNIMEKRFEYPHIYLCSSKKEEFGIAILEALSRGFLIIGPVKGGVKTYITNRENGFLIDTSSYEKIAKETEKIIYYSNIDYDEFQRIQAAGKKTVENLFSIEKISKDFLNFYLSIKGEEKNEI